MKRFPVSLALTVALVVLSSALLGWLQFSFPGLRDSDSYFHAREARELDLHGVRSKLPQAAFSTWSERYADRDLLFHALLIPFQRLHAGPPAETPAAQLDEDLVTPSKQASVAFYALFFGSLAFALWLMGARGVAFWLLLFCTMDMQLLKGFLPVRPGLLGMVFVVLEIALLVERRGRWLALAGALHTLSHSSFVLLFGLVPAAWMAYLLRRERFPPRLALWALAGPLAGSLVHPSVPNNLAVAWDQIVEVGLRVWLGGAAFPQELFGAELLATQTSHFLGSFPAYLPAIGAVVAFLAYPQRRISTKGLALLLMTGALLVPAFLSERFFDFFFPAVVLLGALLWSELLGGDTLQQARRRNAAAFYGACVLLAFCPVAGLSRGSALALRPWLEQQQTADVYRPAVAFLVQAARPDDVVYHNFWWDFAILYYYRPQGRYVVAADPVFFVRHDPARFAQALEAYRGRTADLYRVLDEEFDARWVYLPKVPSYVPFFNLLRAEPRFAKAYEDAHVVIARLP